MSERLSNDVFISYRRDVSQYMAMALWQNLTDRGIDVFYDFESIGAGDFEQTIVDQIACRPYLVPILAPRALERCTEPGDWFLREIEEALSRDRLLVPVHTPEFDPSDIDRFLPSDVAAGVRRFQMLEIPAGYFKAAIAKLADQYLLPVDLSLSEPTPGAVAGSLRLASEMKKAPPVTSVILSERVVSSKLKYLYVDSLPVMLEASYDHPVLINLESAAFGRGDSDPGHQSAQSAFETGILPTMLEMLKGTGARPAWANTRVLRKSSPDWRRYFPSRSGRGVFLYVRGQLVGMRDPEWFVDSADGVLSRAESLINAHLKSAAQLRAQ